MTRVIDLNSDLGEGFGPWTIGDGVDLALMPLITSANVATGFHAGDPGTLARTVQAAHTHGVGLGAHPGFHDLVGFGRRHIHCSPEEVVHDVLYQMGALREFARWAGAPVQHMKPHGALYMHLARDTEAARALIDALQRTDPELPVYCMDGSALCQAAIARGQPVVREFYGDRDYDDSGSIVFIRRVTRPDPVEAAARIVHACRTGTVQSVAGRTVAIDFDSVCIHSDTPGALPLMQATRAALAAADIPVVGMHAALAARRR